MATYATTRKTLPPPRSLVKFFDRVDDLVGEAVVDRLGGRHPIVPFGVLADPLDRLPGLSGEDLSQSVPRLDDLACFNIDVGCRALHAAHRLMQQEARIRQAKTELLLAGR